MDRDWLPDECNRRLEASAIAIDFGSVSLGESASRDFVLENAGTAPIQVDGMVIDSLLAPSPGIRLEPVFEPFVLQPQESRTYRLVYAPETAERFEVSLVVTSDAVNVPRLTVVLTGAGVDDRTRFRRGDCSDDGAVDISDASCILNWLFLGAATPPCPAGTNTNGDAGVDISDATYLLNHLFLWGPVLVAPYPECGLGRLPADEEMGCETTKSCAK